MESQTFHSHAPRSNQIPRPMNTRKQAKTLALLPLLAAGVILLLNSPVRADLLHRYQFNEAPGSATVADSVGTAHGVIAQIDADANSIPDGNPVTFDGTQATMDGTGGFISLPSGLISGLTNVSLEMWVTWGGGSAWQRFFDIGSITNNTGGPGHLQDTNGTLRGAQYWGTKYMFLTPNGGGSGIMRFAATDDYFNAERPTLNDIAPFATLSEVHVTITYGPSGARMFYNGQQVASVFTPDYVPLSSIEDTNFWLGRSLYGGDSMLAGSFNEFRIHNNLLTLQQIIAADMGGPTSTNYDPGTPSGFSMTVANNMIVGGVQIPTFQASFSGTGGPYTLSSGDINFLYSSATNVISVDAGGRLVAVGAGSATITAVLGTSTNTALINVAGLNPVLKNRWSFNEAFGSTTLADTVGGANATVHDGATAIKITLTNGQAVFPTTTTYDTAPWIQLPDGVISSRTNVTIEMWTTWTRAAGNQQRFFDLGSTTKANPNANGTGLTWLSLSPNPGGNVMQLLYSTNGNPVQLALNGTQTPVNQQIHVVVVYAPDSQLSRLYRDGIPRGSGVAPAYLANLIDTNNCLGVSQWNDTPFGGMYNE